MIQKWLAFGPPNLQTAKLTSRVKESLDLELQKQGTSPGEAVVWEEAHSSLRDQKTCRWSMSLKKELPGQLVLYRNGENQIFHCWRPCLWRKAVRTFKGLRLPSSDCFESF